MRTRALTAGVWIALAASLAQAAPDAAVGGAPASQALAAEPPQSAPPGAAPAALAEPGAEPAAPVYSWPPPALDELPERDPVRAAVDRAWRLPATSLPERVARTQRAGLALGLRELDGPARALLFLSDEGSPLERAELAVQLAPGLPAAHAAVARAKLDSGDLPGAWRAASAALAVGPEHLEARAWLTATGASAATRAAFAFALLVGLVGAAASLPSLIYGLAATRLKLTGPAALAVLAAAVMGLALAEGPAGAVLGLGALAVASGGSLKRGSVFAATALGLGALHFGTEIGASGRLMLAADPVAVAVHRIEAGLATPAELGLALRAAATDREAAAAVALHAKRAGELEAATQYFERLLGLGPDAGLEINAANLAFVRGDLKRAIALYERATANEPQAVGYFNLSQAYGRAIRLDEQDRALVKAQRVDGDLVAHLTGGSGAGHQAFVTDVATSAAAVAARAAASPGPKQLSAIERERLAPGWLGRSLSTAGAVALAVLALALAGGSALERAAGPRDFYADLARTLRTGVGDSAQRVAQLTRLRSRRARNERLLTLLALLVPGAAGPRFGRPLAGLLASAACAIGVAALLAERVAPPDPLAVGALSGLLIQLTLAASITLYVVATLAAFALRRED